MKTLTSTFLVLFILILAGCAEETPATSGAAESNESVIEISEEEAELLEAVSDTTAESLEPVTSDNYEEKLEEMEAILNDDSE